MVDDIIYPEKPIMVIDDEVQSIRSIEIALRSSQINNIETFSESPKAKEALETKEYELVLLDLSMPNISGEELLRILAKDYPDIPAIVITGLNDVQIAVKCMKNGAVDYILKPLERNRLISSVKRHLEIHELRRQNLRLKHHVLSKELSNPDAFSEIVTQNENMHSIFQYLEAVAQSPQPVLITGETGSGKELIAKCIHNLSKRNGEFVAVNMGGLDDTLFSDTLFGHVKGAFTGAEASRKGLIETASGGTLFLDEIGDIHLPSQTKLLRLLQEKEYFPLGADIAKPSNVRVIVATHKNLNSLQQEDKFRKDLFYRLKVHNIHVPPLRERLDDLHLLIDFFIQKASEKLNKKLPSYPPELITLLSTYSFPGNIRELESIIFDSISKHTSKMLSLENFKKYLDENNSHTIKDQQTKISERNFMSFNDKLPTIKESTRLLIEEALKRTNGNQSIAARILGVSQQALSKRLKTMANDNSE